MPETSAAQRKAAAMKFAEEWAGRGYEKGDTQTFWLELLNDVVGMDNARNECKFEYHTAEGGFIDCWIPDAGVLVEQKSLGVDLDKPEERQGKLVTPFEQALAYAESLPMRQQPRFIVTCNFGTFRVYDRDRHSRHDLPDNYVEFSLEELGTSPSLLSFIVDPSHSRAEKERQISMQAGELIGKLRDELEARFIDPKSDESQHALNVLCVRIVFCLFCEDAGLFEKDGFYNYLRDTEPDNIRGSLKRLFRALDTPVGERDPYDEKVKPFPYVNGGLFSEETEIPNFDADLKELLLEGISRQTDWSGISPTIFGGIFESTLNPETRREGGMHYTGVENIHKVIDPLFLDGLLDEFHEIKDAAGLTERKRKNAYRRLLKKIASLKFLDPACGSGNFLTETYLSLRRLQDDILNELFAGQVMIDYKGEEEEEEDVYRVTLSQFSGIEINDFAVRVAKTSLWIAQLQSNNESEMLLKIGYDDFPLRDSANVVKGNALRMDWNEVLSAKECSYVMGNPPFVGYSNLNDEQKKDRAELFGKVKVLDYVACWYKKAADYIAQFPVRCAFVSTNSICQGQQVEPLWRPLFEEGIGIDFAYRTFVWNSEATDQAHVHVIIVGFSRQGHRPKLLWNEKGNLHEASNINGYLSDASNEFVSKRNAPLCNVPGMAQGFKPADNGFLLLSSEEREALLKAEPAAEKWIRPFSMGAEFIKGQDRYCLWLADITPSELKALPHVRARVDACREWRSSQKETGDAYKLKDTPHLLRPCGKFVDGVYIGVPKVSSSRRKYVPIGFVANGMIPGDMLYFVPTESLYVFGIMLSQFQNAWMRTVCGRLKSDYRISNTIVYNNFVWPGAVDRPDVPVEEAIPPDVREQIETCSQAVLDARAAHPDSTLADMYDPDNDFLYPDLVKAHRELDAAVEAAYGVDFNGDEEKIVAHLFELYAQMTAGGESK
ncbi:MAG: class I SAM-dependent DNA methyltransferase [Coriobacteriales bacterium]